MGAILSMLGERDTWRPMFQTELRGEAETVQALFDSALGWPWRFRRICGRDRRKLRKAPFP
jgi:hypothetical protein